MNDKYLGKYRIPSARLPGWDYRWAEAYFITICTRNREHFFGEIVDDRMVLSPLGVLADVFWHEIPNHVKNVSLGAFQVMPNHLHGISILHLPDIVSPDIVETLHATSLQYPETPEIPETPETPQNPPTLKSTPNTHMSAISPKSGSVSRIVGSYKGAVTKHANRLGLPFGWQERFYDHIIRDEAAYNAITHYILTNPQNWARDQFYNL